jgi:hypothetical protein
MGWSVRRVWGRRGRVRATFGFVELVLGAVAFNADAAEDAAEEGEADAGDQEENRVGEVAGEIGVQENADACVDEDGEDVAESASRHGVPPCQEDGGLTCWSTV